MKHAQVLLAAFAYRRCGGCLPKPEHPAAHRSSISRQLSRIDIVCKIMATKRGRGDQGERVCQTAKGRSRTQLFTKQETKTVFRVRNGLGHVLDNVLQGSVLGPGAAVALALLKPVQSHRGLRERYLCSNERLQLATQIDSNKLRSTIVGGGGGAAAEAASLHVPY